MTPTENAIPIKAITYEGNLQCDQEELDKIKSSIQDLGFLLHPITVQRLPFNGDMDRYELVAGKKRLRAFKELGHSQIPALIFEPSVPPEKVREAHLHENLRRSNIPWYEISELELQLHTLRLEQHGQRGSERRDKSKDKWSMLDTARELGKSIGSVSLDLQLAQAVRQNPYLKKVKDRQTAVKLVKELIRREEAMADAQIPSEFEMNQIFCGDSLEILKSFPNALFDAVITDPPWVEYKDDKLTRDESTIAVFREVYRVMKPNSILYAIMSSQDFPVYLEELPKFGFTVQKYPLIWKKSGTMTHGRRQWEYARDYEPMLLAAKGSPVLTIHTEMSAIFDFPAVPAATLRHPHQKPIELLKKIIGHCTFDGGKILDPFAGSGVTLEAAKEMGRGYIGIERDHKFFTNIERRLGKWVNQ